jgi:hypothetical protein
MSKSILIALAFVAGVITPAGAAPLGPKKASELVTLQPNPILGAAPCAGVEAPLDRVVQADLSTSQLVIPPGQVLVITGGNWQLAALGVQPNLDTALRLYLKDGTNVAAVLYGAGGLTDADGAASGSFRADPGIVVRPGQSICAVLRVGGADKGGFIFAYGYFTKDK